MKKKSINSRNKSYQPKPPRRPTVRRKKTRLKKKNIFIACLIVFAILFGVFKVAKGIYDAKQERLRIERQAKLQASRASREANRNVIVIDAGRGGADYGTKSMDGSIKEKNINLEIARKVVDKLSKHDDITVVMTRVADVNMTTKERAAIAKKHKAKVLVSINCNALAADPSVYGIETYYRPYDEKNPKIYNNSKRLARAIQETLVTFVNSRDRGILERNTDIFRDSDAVCAVVECGFLTNSREAENLNSQGYQEQLADGISQGILFYLDDLKLEKQGF